MKWITPLWSDPIGWSEWVAKTKVHVLIWTLIHIAFVAWGLVMIQKFGVMAGAFPIIFIAVAYPCLYLCAMHQLLKIAKQRQIAEQHTRIVSSEATRNAFPDEPPR